MIDSYAIACSLLLTARFSGADRAPLDARRLRG